MSLAKLAEEDRIYCTRENRAWCKERGIRISGYPLGRPPAHVSPEKKTQAVEDEKIRNAICLKIRDLRKRRFDLNRVMAKLDNACGTAIAITFLVMNLFTWLRLFFFRPISANNTWLRVSYYQQLYFGQLSTTKTALAPGQNN